MTAGLPDIPAAELNAWAAGQLQVSPGASPGEVQAALWRSLPEADFVPAPAVDQAWRILIPRRSVPAPGVSMEDRSFQEKEEQWRAEVEQFAQEFFNLSPTDRHRRWQDLHGRFAWSRPLAARLKALAVGLTVNRDAYLADSPQRRRLAHYVCDLFVLRPAERAAQRRALLEGMAAEMAEWERPANRLFVDDPALARLEPEFLRQVASWRTRQRAKAKRRTRTRSGRRAPASSQGGGWIAWVAIIVVVGLVRLVANMHTNRREVEQLPRFNQPPVFDPDRRPDDPRIKDLPRRRNPQGKEPPEPPADPPDPGPMPP
jgi:hypothetical protein